MSKSDTHTSGRLQRFFVVLALFFGVQWWFYEATVFNEENYDEKQHQPPDPSELEILGLQNLNKTGKYAIVSANNCGPGKKKCPGLEYAYDIFLTAKVWKTHGFGTMAVLTGDSETWKNLEPWKTILQQLLNAKIICMILQTPSIHSVGMAQIGRLFVSNFLKSHGISEIEDLYLITSDSDFFPLLTHRLSLKEGKTVLATNPQTSWRDVSKNDMLDTEIVRGKRDLGENGDRIYENWPKGPNRLPIYVALSCVGATVTACLRCFKTCLHILYINKIDNHVLKR